VHQYAYGAIELFLLRHDARAASRSFRGDLIFRHRRTDSQSAPFGGTGSVPVLFEPRRHLVGYGSGLPAAFDYAHSGAYFPAGRQFINNAVIGLPPRDPLGKLMLRSATPNRWLPYDT